MNKILMFLKQLLCSVLSIFGISCGGGEDIKNTPPVLRSDLLFGYYGDCKTCLEETKAHSNLYWVWGWDSDSSDWWTNTRNHLFAARGAGLKTVLGLPQLYQDNPETKIRVVFDLLRNDGLLDGNIIALYPIDEPDIQHFSAEKVTKANDLLRFVMKDYPEFANTKLAVIYTGGMEWPGIESYDWVGFDDYDKKEEVLFNKQWQSLKGRLRPDQRILLVPGGSDPWRQDPTPFFNKAQNDSQVIGIIPFIWFDFADIGVGRGIRTNSMRFEYCKVGRKIKYPDKEVNLEDCQ